MANMGIDLEMYTLEELKELAKMTNETIKEKQKIEIAETVRKLMDIAEATGLTIEDLLQPYKRKAYPPSRVKYRNPDNPEQVWSGRGQKPLWFRKKLEQGYPIDHMQVSQK